MLESELSALAQLEEPNENSGGAVIMERLLNVEGMLRRVEASLDRRLQGVDERLNAILKAVRHPEAGSWKGARSEDIACYPAGESEGGSGQDAGQVTQGVDSALIAEMGSGETQNPKFVDPRFVERVVSSEERVSRLRPRLKSQASKHLIAVVNGGKSRLANEGKHSGASRFAVHPSSSVRLAYDIACLLASLYDCIMVPLELAYTIELSGFVKALEITVMFVWVADLFLQFFMGYYDNEFVFMDLTKIAKKYLKTEFLLSLVIVSCDLFAFSLMYANSESRINLAWTSMLRLARVPRGIRALRKGAIAFQGVLLRVTLGGVFYVAIRLLQFIAVMVWSAHLCACVWAVFGERARERYLVSYDLQDMITGVAFEYLINFYWAINVITAANNIMIPITEMEHAIIMASLVFGLLACSVIIGVVGDVLIDLRSKNHIRYNRVITLRKYLKQNRISFKHSKHIENVARSICNNENSQRRVVEDDVELLNHLPPSLGDTLRATVYGPIMCTQVFFYACDALDKMLVYNICSKALERSVMNPNELVFERGTDALGAYFILWGKGEYSDMTLSMDTVPSAESQQEGSKRFVKHCQWICELALFCSWEHSGTLRTAERSEVLKVNADGLLAIMKQFEKLRSIMSNYANILCQIVQQSASRFESDLVMPIKHEEVVRLMPAHERVQMSSAGLTMLNSSFLTRMGLASAKNASQLKLEVAGGASDLVVTAEMRTWNDTPEFKILRVIAHANLRLRDENGAVLVELGYYSKGEFTREVRLPGTTVKAQELPSHATERLLEGPLGSMKHAVTLTGRLTSVEVKQSGSYSVETKYIRYITTGEVAADWAKDRNIRHVADPSIDLGLEAFVLDGDITSSLTVYCWADHRFLVANDMVDPDSCPQGEQSVNTI